MEEPIRRERRPWTGKVYNPRELHEQQAENKRNLTRADFEKTQKPAILKRFETLESAINSLATAVKGELDKINAKLGGVNAKRPAPVDDED